MIRVRGLTHRYGPVLAVEGIDFDVQVGEILGILGPNGAGKSTTMRAVVGLLSPTEGSIQIDGQDLATHPREARQRLGYLPEAVPLYRELKVREFLSFAARVKGVARAELKPEVDRVVDACGLAPVADRLIGFCSRGFRQRVGLAQALAGDPPALVLDEPTVGLDPAQVVDIRETIARLSANKAVILSTHILPEASLLCSKVLIMNQGRRLAEDSPENLTQTVSRAPLLRVVCRADATSTLAALEPVVRTEPADAASGLFAWTVQLREGATASELVTALLAAGCPVEEIRPERLGLEEVFLRLVREEATA